jgi:hypothetical protein
MGVPHWYLLVLVKEDEGGGHWISDE